MHGLGLSRRSVQEYKLIVSNQVIPLSMISPFEAKIYFQYVYRGFRKVVMTVYVRNIFSVCLPRNSKSQNGGKAIINI